MKIQNTYVTRLTGWAGLGMLAVTLRLINWSR